MKLLIIGGVAAGMSAATKARRVNPALKIVVYERSGYVSYGACGFPYFLKGEVASIEQLLARTPAQFAEQGITVRTCHEVTAVHPTRREVTVHDLKTGRMFTDSWDRLILAAGGVIAPPAFPGGRLPGIFSLRTVEDALAIRQWMAQVQPQTAVLVGAGYVGLEMAEAFCAHGIDVTIVEQQPQVLPSLDAKMADFVQQALAQNGVKVQLETAVSSFVGETLLHDIVTHVAQKVQGGAGSRLRVREVVTDQGSLPADIVIMGIGGRPNSGLAQAAGMKLGPTWAVAVDAAQATNLPNIWAAGAVAEAHHLVTGQPTYHPLATTASKQGRVAGTNAAGGQARFNGVVGTAVVKTFDLHVGQTGLTEKAARQHGLDVQSALVTGSTKPHYMPGHTPLHVKLVFESGTQRLLGAQIVGQAGVAKRIDVIAAALHAGWTTRDLADLDLSYTPAMAPLWDPILIAASVANKQ